MKVVLAPVVVVVCSAVETRRVVAVAVNVPTASEVVEVPWTEEVVLVVAFSVVEVVVETGSMVVLLE